MIPIFIRLALISIIALSVSALYGCSDKESPVAPGIPTTIGFDVTGPTLTALGETVQLTATVRDQFGQPMPSASLTWISSDPGVASVSSSGLVTSHANGVATIRASSGAAEGSLGVTVQQRPRTLQVDTDFARLPRPGDSLRLRAVVRDAREQVMVDAQVTWSSSDPQVASVSSAGLVSAVADGLTVLTAQVDTIQATTRILVQAVPPRVVLARRTHTLTAVGDTLRLAATVEDARGRTLEGLGPVWSSQDPRIASVSPDGRLRAEGFGNTEVVAALDGVAWGVTVRVDSPLRLLIKEADVYSFVDNTRSPSYEYAGQWNEGGLVSFMPQASGVFDLWSGGGPDVFVPIVRGYATGLDARTKPLFFRNEGGRLVHATNEIDVPQIAGSRHTLPIDLPNDPFRGLMTIAHDAHDGRMADILMVAGGPTPRDMTHRVAPLPLMELTGRPTAINSHSGAAGDITGNGRTDFAIGDWGVTIRPGGGPPEGCDSCAPFLLIQGEDGQWTVRKDEFMRDITFRQPLLHPGAGENINLLLSLHLADLNGDGLADLVTGYGHGSSLSHVYFNQGDGRFTRQASVALPEPPFGVNNSLHLKTYSLDLTGDGALDLVINWSQLVPYYAGYAHQILINDGSGNFRDETQHRLRSIPEFDVPAGRLGWSDRFEFMDVTGDGHPDLIGSHFGHWENGQEIYPNRVRLWLNNGAGILSEVPVEVEQGPVGFGWPLGWADFAGDGKVGILTQGSRWTDNVGTAQRIIFTHWEFDRRIR
jgi:hypothetical protein